MNYEKHLHIAKDIADLVWKDALIRKQIIKNKWGHINAKHALEDNLYKTINELVLELSNSGENDDLIYKKMSESLFDHVLELTKGPPEPAIVTWEEKNV